MAGPRVIERQVNMNPSPSPSLLEVIRQLLQKVEGASYPKSVGSGNSGTLIPEILARFAVADLECSRSRSFHAYGSDQEFTLYCSGILENVTKHSDINIAA
jgi:hypothetical protein